MTAVEFAFTVIYGMHQEVPVHLRHRSTWVMNEETNDYLGSVFGPPDKPGELIGLPVRVVAGNIFRLESPQ